MSRSGRWAGIGFLAALFLVSIGGRPGSASAVGCEVTSLDDSGTGTLRAAMENADCDAITFEDSLIGTISLATDLPSIDRELTITGPGADVITISRGTIHSTNIGFHAVAGGEGVISGLTITNTRNCAEASGGSLTLRRMDLHTCYHAAEASGGTLIIEDSEIFQIASHAIIGGGVITVSGSALYNNYANVYIVATTQLLTLVNNSFASTQSDNVWIAYGPAHILNNTISGGFTGLGLFAGTSGSIVTNNIFVGTGNNCGRDLNSTATFKNNMSDGATNCFSDGVDGNQVIPSGSHGLQPLAANGGPTPSFALYASSPAVDAGQQSTCIAVGAGAVNGVDQRGVSRTTGAGAACDIGSFERNTTCIVASAADNSIEATLRRHMLDTSCSTITFDLESMGTSNIFPSATLPTVARHLEIVGPGSDMLMIRASIGLIFRVEGANARLKMSGLSSHDPVINLLVGFTDVGESLVLDDVNFFASGTNLVLNGGDQAVVRNSSLTANLYGATVNANKLTLESSTVSSGNTGLLVSTEVEVSSSVVSGDSSAIYFDDYTTVATVVNSTITNSYRAISPTGGGTLTVLSSTIAGNAIGIDNPPGLDLIVKNTILKNFSDDCTTKFGGLAFENSIAISDDCFDNGVNGNLVVSEADLALDPDGLQDNGGPTETIAILAGSLARDAANKAVCIATGAGQVNGVDQRGVSRVSGTTCDIGAFEFERSPQTIPPFTLPDAPLASGSSVVQGISSAGLPLEYSGAISCSVTGGVITFVQAGLCEITATQPGNSEYLPAPPFVTTFMIFGPGPVTTVTLSPANPNGTNGWYRTPVDVSVSATHPTQTPVISCGTELGATSTYTWGTIPGTCFSGTNSGQFFDSGVFTITAGATTIEQVQGDLVHRTVKIDKNAPNIFMVGAVNGGSYLHGSVPFTGCGTSDFGSGIAQNASLVLTGGNQWGGGTFTATCSGAVDVAGNVAAPVSVSYNVTCEPTRTSQGIVMVKVNAMVKVPRVTRTTVHFNPATCAVVGVTMAPVGAPQQGSLNLATQNSNWKPVAQTGADTWQFGVKTANAGTGGVYLNNAYRALNGSTVVTLKLTNDRTLAYIKVAGMAPTGVGITLAAIEAETSPTIPLLVP